MFKVICSDLDGTLLDNNSELSEENFLAIEKLTEKGYLFVPATGRTYGEIPEAVREHKSIRYFIYSNGSVIYDKLEDKRYEIPVSHEKILEIIEVLKNLEYVIHVETIN